MIKVKYLDKSITKLEKTEKGDLIDLRVSTVDINGKCEILGKCSSGKRIAQFDITPVYLKDHELITVEKLSNKNRGGYGTTGVE